MESKLHDKLKEARKAKKLSQNEVAEQLHRSRQTISQWELGKAEPDMKSLKALCELYDVSVSEMLGEERKEQEITEKKDLLPILEIPIIAMIVGMASQVAILGVLVSVAIAIWISVQKRSMKKKWIVFLICLVGFILSAQYTYTLVGYWFFPDAGVGTVQQL